MKILVLNGPNLNLLGVRNPEIYGTQSYKDLENYLYTQARIWGIEVSVFQSNVEGELVTKIQEAIGKFDGIIINAAAYTHSSIAILEALEAAALPAVEVHLSNIHAREAFRHISYPAKACITQIAGCGFRSYKYALEELKELLDEKS